MASASVRIHDRTLLPTRTNGGTPCGPPCPHLDLTLVSTKVVCPHEISDISHVLALKYPIWIEHHTYFLPISVRTRIRHIYLHTIRRVIRRLGGNCLHPVIVDIIVASCPHRSCERSPFLVASALSAARSSAQERAQRTSRS